MKTNKTPYVIKNWNKNVINWSEALINYNESFNNKNLVKSTLGGTFVDPCFSGFFASHEAHKIKKVSKVLKDYNLKIAHLYFNIITKAKTFGKHRDPTDVWFWQCQGVTRWIVNVQDDITNTKDQEIIELNPSDLIYVPANVWHEVIPLTPRVGVSMSKE